MAPLNSRLRLFENRWLEKLTVISFSAFIPLWILGLSLIAWSAWGATNLTEALLLAAAGLILWTFAEYFLHRFVFHWKPQSAAMSQVVFIVHGNHHAIPNDRLRNLMPPIISLPLGGLIWAGMVGLLGLAGSWLFFGFMVGYVAYDLVHYACHQFPMKGRLASKFKLHHMRHHHPRENGNYAITGMIWDRVFNTLISRVTKA